jgi:hypothetical protein
MSGRDQASGAGDRSSVLVSPVTLKTVSFWLAGTAGREVNHSPSAQDWHLALALPPWRRSDVVEEVEHQQGLLEAFSGGAGFAVEQVDQGDVVAAEHGAQQFGGLDLGDGHRLRPWQPWPGTSAFTRHRRRGGRSADPPGRPAGRRVLQFDQSLGLLLRQGQRRDAEGGALGNMLAVGFKHG